MALKLTVTPLLPAHLSKDLSKTDARYLPVLTTPDVPDTYGDYEKAQQLARMCDLRKGQRIYARLSGSFIYGDFIEALFVEYGIRTQRLIISTYSYSLNNVDSLRTLLEAGYVQNLDLLVGNMFYNTERKAGGLIPYTYRELDIDNRFQLGVCDTHDKLAAFATEGGKHIVMHGSCNLRSSGSLEHVMIEDNELLYNFVVPPIDRLINSFKTINKSARGGPMWDIVTDKQSNK